MIRTQIQLEERQARRLREAARLEGVSLAEMIRRCVDRALPEFQSERARRYQYARDALGKYSTAADDIAEGHDAYLDEDFE